MVQEGAAPAPQAGASGAAKKKKNKNKNKKKTGAAQPDQPPQQQNKPGSEERSRSSSETTPAPEPVKPVSAAPVANCALPVITTEGRNKPDLMSNIAKEFAENYAVYSNYSEVRDAERAYHQHLAKKQVRFLPETNIFVPWFLFCLLTA